MGEAKRRRDNTAKEQKFGQGLLFPPPYEKIDGGFRTIPLNKDKLVSGILYWDKLACPIDNIVYSEIEEEVTLIKEGILVRPRSHIDMRLLGPNIHSLMIRERYKQFAALNHEAPSCWAFADGSVGDITQGEGFMDGSSILIDLIGALPVPEENVPIDKVLEFKSRRLDELKNLQLRLQETFLSISQEGNQNLALRVELMRLDNALKDTARTSKEWWKNIKFADLQSAMPLFAAGGIALGLPIQMPELSALALGGIGLFNVHKSVDKKLKSDRKLPYWFAAEVRRELVK